MPDEDVPHRRKTTAGDPHPVEHFIEVLLIAKDRAAAEIDIARCQLWQQTIRDIETVLADDTMEVVAARERLAQRDDPEGRRMHACACQLVRAHDAASREAKAAIERTRKS